MSVSSILKLGRRRRQALMRSTCRILRPGGDQVWDPATGTYTTPDELVIYEGKCQIKPTFSPAERDADAGDREVVLRSYDVVIPSDASPEVDVADVVVFTESDDEWLIGQRLAVGHVEQADTRTARRVTVWTQDRTGVTHA